MPKKAGVGKLAPTPVLSDAADAIDDAFGG